MARAAGLRLRAALEEYVAENKGDGPRGNARGIDKELVQQAEALLSGMAPAEGRTQGGSPGQRAAGIQPSDPSRATASASQRAREVLGATGAAAGDGER